MRRAGPIFCKVSRAPRIVDAADQRVEHDEHAQTGQERRVDLDAALVRLDRLLEFPSP